MSLLRDYGDIMGDPYSGSCSVCFELLHNVGCPAVKKVLGDHKILLKRSSFFSVDLRDAAWF